jgi:hypothetical protein
MNAVVDNDIVLKGVCYGILSDVLQPHNGRAGTIGVLGTARFVVSNRIKKVKLTRSENLILEELARFLSCCTQLNPTEHEQRLAAELEFAAQQLGLGLDTGESQLCAISILRAISKLFTGDKRAITAMERLLDGHTALLAMSGRVWCLEQAISILVAGGQLQSLRSAICSEPTVDKVLTICFACNSPDVQPETVVEGLNSYIGALRADAGRVLAVSV